MIDININAIISQALAAAVQQALQPLQQEYANKMGQMAQRSAALDDRIAALERRVAALEYQSANRHERLLALEGALTERVLALENNPAQGVDTTLERRITALEAATQPGETLERLDNQEWFWNKIRNFTDTAVEQAIEEHNETYDHDDFVTEDKLDDYVKNDSFRDDIREVLNNATISLSI